MTEVLGVSGYHVYRYDGKEVAVRVFEDGKEFERDIPKDLPEGAEGYSITAETAFQLWQIGLSNANTCYPINAETSALQGINAKIAQYAPIKIETDDSKLTETQKQVKALLIKAARVIDDIFWMQYSSDGLALRQQLETSTDPLDKARLHYLLINYGRYDSLAEGTPAFIGEGNRPRGGIFYPEPLTKEAFEAFVAGHPEVKTDFQKPNTFIAADAEKGLIAVPFEKIYRDQLEFAAGYLKQAAEVTDDPLLQRYLFQKAEDLVGGDYTQSDIYWLDLKESPLDIVIGYMETYDDGLTGAKASYEAMVVQRDAAASRPFEEYKKKLPEFQSKLPVRAELRSKVPVSKPIGVFDLAYAGGDANQDVKAIAVNLPNTEEVRAKHGNRIIQFRNVLEAKAEKILLPIAERTIDDSQLTLVGKAEFASFTVQHEISHSLGEDYATDPHTLQKTGIKIRGALKELYGGIEECKADVLAAYNIRHLDLTIEEEMRSYVTNLASIFRSIRFGIEESHGQANIIALNFLKKEGAIAYNPETGKWRVVGLLQMRKGIAKLSTELLEIEGYGDYNRAKALIENMAKLTPEVTATLARFKGIPVDLEFIQ